MSTHQHLDMIKLQVPQPRGLAQQALEKADAALRICDTCWQSYQTGDCSQQAVSTGDGAVVSHACAFFAATTPVDSACRQPHCTGASAHLQQMFSGISSSRRTVVVGGFNEDARRFELRVGSSMSYAIGKEWLRRYLPRLSRDPSVFVRFNYARDM